jgi:hypothetical protein
LLHINALPYVEIGQIYERYMRFPAQSEMLQPGTSSHDSIVASFASLLKQCSDTNMVVSKRGLEKALAGFQFAAVDTKDVRKALDNWFTCFTSELETHIFMMLVPHRIIYLPLQGEGVKLQKALGDFPDAQYDAWEACICLACARFSASVYHLMRIAEHGLVSVAAAANVKDETLAKGWDGCIQGIDSEVKRIESTKPTLDWKDQVKKYTDLSAWFTTIKTGWRNPASHIPRIYEERSATGMFAAVCTLFSHLSRYGFKQTRMPSDPLPPPTA